MATKTRANTPSEAVAVATGEAATKAVEETKQETVPEFNWDAIGDAEVAEYVRGPVTIDVEEATPWRIKTDLQASFTKFDADANGGKGKPHWLTQTLGSPEMAQAYLKLARRYGKFRGWTIRGGATPDDARKIRFCAKPFEARKRTPKSDDQNN
jgi:hypothetical protein